MQTDNNTGANELLRGPSNSQGPTNDNSNPQQGTGNHHKQDGKHSDKHLEKHAGASKISVSVKKTDNDPTRTVKNSKPVQPSLSKIPPNKKDSRKLFVGGLPQDITSEEFRTYFAQFGDLLDAVVMFDRDTHRSRGFGFVTYVDQNVSNRLLEMKVDDDNDNDSDNTEGKGKTTSESGKTSDNGIKIGRMVMRGKVMEIKAAQPKNAGSGRTASSRRSNKQTSAKATAVKPTDVVPVGSPSFVHDHYHHYPLSPQLAIAPEYMHAVHHPMGYLVHPTTGAPIPTPIAQGYAPAMHYGASPYEFVPHTQYVYNESSPSPTADPSATMPVGTPIFPTPIAVGHVAPYFTHDQTGHQSLPFATSHSLPPNPGQPVITATVPAQATANGTAHPSGDHQAVVHDAESDATVTAETTASDNATAAATEAPDARKDSENPQGQA